MATEIDRRLKVEKQAKQISNLSGGMEQGAASLLSQVHVALQRYWREAVDRADTELDKLDGNLVMEKGHLENCRPSAIQAQLEGDLRKILDDVNPELGPIAKNCAYNESQLKQFRAQHGLNDTVSWGKETSSSDFRDLLLIMFAEFVLNTLFFSGSQKNGLIGGAGLALQLSIAPIVLGGALGLSYQFMHRESEGKGWLGRIGAPIIGAVAIYYLLLLTLARFAGDQGQIDMFSIAAREIQSHPFSGLLDLPALAYFFFSIAVIGAVFYKFINALGVFPGLWKRTLSAKRSDRQFETDLSEMMDASRKLTADEIKRLDAVPDIIQQTVVPIKELQMNYENVIDQYRNDVRDIRDSERLLVGVVNRYMDSGSYREISANDGHYAADHDVQMIHLDERLADFQNSSEQLLAWEEVSQSSIDKCRDKMTVAGQENLKEIEMAAKSVRERHVAELARIEKI